jgi:prepilin signal peptidase PulO-like enzyme (type II secretory pathway)
MLLLLASFFFAEPLVTLSSQPPQRRSLPIKPGWSLMMQQRSLEALTCAWFFMLGASLGSFIHCLEYRWPRGVSVVARGSACPGCGKAIRLWHNVPVFGWLWLRGRCARCGWEIPARYAITELILGTVFVLLLSLELIGAGLNLPVEYAREQLGVTENIWAPNWRLIGIFAWHAALMTFLVTLSLFAWDRFGIPLLLVAMALAVGIICPLVWPVLQVVQWDDLVSPLADSRLRIAVGQLAGALAGLLLGNCLVRRTPGNIRAGDVGATLLGMLLVGLYLGWQAALAIAALTVLIRASLPLTSARRWPVVVSIALATLIHLLAWRWLMQFLLYPLLHNRILATLAAVVAVPVVAALVDSIEHGGDAGPTIIDPQPIAEAASLPAARVLEDPVPEDPVT